MHGLMDRVINQKKGKTKQVMGMHTFNIPQTRESVTGKTDENRQKQKEKESD